MIRRASLLALAFVLVTLGLNQASASCSATWNCSDAPTISCSGFTGCNSGADGTGWIQCNNGLKEYCPDCSQNGICNESECFSDPDCACPLTCKYDSDCGPWGRCYNRSCICV